MITYGRSALAAILPAVFSLHCAIAQHAACTDGAHCGAAHPETRTTAAVLWQPSMNVFRRFEAPAERMYEF